MVFLSDCHTRFTRALWWYYAVLYWTLVGLVLSLPIVVPVVWWLV